ncbi:3813_t:CDS:2 [Entrophospora sp. SA101]|nr:3813_t:CDS:2 [Entrophospora sp. SA101]CAJ0925928.1 5675_t:CDS:2 [Entrophospora sp. SA101]
MSEVTEASLMSPPVDTTPDNNDLDSEVLDPDDLDSKDWDMIEYYSGHLIGIMLIVFSIYLRIQYILDEIVDKPFLSNNISSIEWLLLILSVIHATYFFTRTKRYQLFDHEVDVKPRSKNVSLKELHLEQSNWTTKFPANVFYPLYQHFFKKRVIKEEEDHIWVLKKWDPSIFSSILFW